MQLDIGPNPTVRSVVNAFIDSGIKPTKEYDPPLDPGIKEYVEELGADGIETFESCQGGEGHCYPEPTIRFEGDLSEGFRALAIAMRARWPVNTLRRTWSINADGPAGGPFWEMTFHPIDLGDNPELR